MEKPNEYKIKLPPKEKNILNNREIPKPPKEIPNIKIVIPGFETVVIISGNNNI